MDENTSRSEAAEREIEVTEEMIEAGMEVYLSHSSAIYHAEEGAARAMIISSFRAMLSKLRGPQEL